MEVAMSDAPAALTEAAVHEALRGVLDPELGIDIVSLGLVERIESAPGSLRVGLIMTALACPLHGHLAREAEAALRRVAPGGTAVAVQVLDAPAWSPARMGPETRRLLGW
jgi:metal-sulfur cluster biosynthetic enzyme